MFQVLVAVHREHKVKRVNQQDATNSMFVIKLSVSTCFGHHYVHRQENKTVSYCMRCSAWVCRLWWAVDLWSCVVSCVSCVEVTVRQYAVGHGLILLMMVIMMPETCWHRKFDNKHRISCILLVLSLHLRKCLFRWFIVQCIKTDIMRVILIFFVMTYIKRSIVAC